jgi:uncharacterized phage protein (TIGR01671 family)
MREIKFRAWEYNHKTKEWKMNYNPTVEDCECFGEFSMVNLNKALENGGDADYDKNSIYTDSDGNKINKEETKSIFQQYTGLKDKNGKDIYEGDIIKVPIENGATYQVVFNKGGFTVKNIDSKTSQPASNEYLRTFAEQEEVIGNIYENPELINQ